MRTVRLIWQSVYDVRPGEGARTFLMALHMLFVLFAYYILKPVSRALFLSKFEIDKLPLLNVLIAACGGLLAYLYTRAAVKTSLRTAIFWSTGVVLVCLLTIWHLLKFDFGWMLYVFNIWVSLFSIILVSQAWLVAANVFQSREAKRLYGLLGLGAVLGAALGGEFTALVARAVETRHLLLASGVMVLLAFAALMAVAALKNVNLAAAKGAEAEPEFAFGDIVVGIRRHPHLQVIMGIIILMFIVDVLVDYQFSALAKLKYPRKEDLTAFLGSFFGIYLNFVTFSLQFFLTAVIVRRLGVGGTLQIMPVLIGLTSLILITFPRMGVAAVVRILEAGTRYTLNKTGMELLYLPLPTDLKNRTKAFVDIFIDRFGRGIGGLVLLGFTALFVAKGKQPDTRQVAWLVVGFCLIWIFLSAMASRAYVATIRHRLASRRLDLSEVHLSVGDAGAIALLERQLTEGTPRQAAYALGLLAEAAEYEIAPWLDRLAGSPHAEVRRKVYEAAAAIGRVDLLDKAWSVVESGSDWAERRAALQYLASPAAGQAITEEWVAGAAADPDPVRRALAAQAIQFLSADPGEELHRLLQDSDIRVIEAACRAAGALGDRRHIDTLVRHLSRHAVRGAAIESLAAFGPRICGALGDRLLDSTAPLAIRCRIPRVLRLIPVQRSVDILLAALETGEHTVGSEATVGGEEAVGAAVLKALNRLRETAPDLDFKPLTLGPRLADEIRAYFELGAKLDPLKAPTRPRGAVSLLVKSLEIRLARIEDRLFRLLALRYPPAEMYSAFLAVRSRQADKTNVALDYLESTLERDWKRLVLPLFDGPARVVRNARDLFGLEPHSLESSLRSLIAGPDAWLSACAMAGAAELNLRAALPEIERAGTTGGPENAAVARAAAVALA